MSQRVFLIRSTSGHAEVLAEANSYLPLFWLTFIKVQDLQNRISELEKAECAMQNEGEEVWEHYRNQYPGATHIKVPGKIAMANAQAAASFISNSFPHVAESFADFISYIGQRLAPDDDLELDIFALSGFTDLQNFTQVVTKDLQAIERHQARSIRGYFEGDVRYTLTGYAGDFEKQSGGFTKVSQVKNQIPRTPFIQQIPLNGPELRSRRTKSVILLLISTAIILTSVFYTVSHGVSFSIIVVVFISILGIWESIRKLRSKVREVR